MGRVSTLDAANPPKVDGKVDWDEDFFAERTGLTVSGQLQAELFARTADPDFYKGGKDDIAVVNDRLAAIESELADVYDRWEELEALGGEAQDPPGR